MRLPKERLAELLAEVEQIRAEIVRLRNQHEKAARACSGLNAIAMTHGGAEKVCIELLAFIDSLLAEQLIDGNKMIEPNEDLDVTDFSKPLDPDVARAIADNLWNENEKLSKDFEEAAETFNRENAAKMWDYEGKTEGEIVESAFIAGAKWQAEHTEDYPMPEDTVLFQKGVAEGKRLMMEEAVEVPLYRDGDFFASIDIDMATLGYTDNDKVKIIIVKEE